MNLEIFVYLMLFVNLYFIRLLAVYLNSIFIYLCVSYSRILYIYSSYFSNPRLNWNQEVLALKVLQWGQITGNAIMSFLWNSFFRLMLRSI